MNIKSNNGTIQTINLINLTTQLNELTDILNGASGGTISDTQLNYINNMITDIKQNLDSFKVDVERFIDETELKIKTDEIESKVNAKLDTNTFTTQINNITTQLSTLSGQISTLSSSIPSVDLSNYYTKTETSNEITNELSTKIRNLESTFKTEIETEVLSNIATKLSELKTDINKTTDNSITEKLKQVNTNISTTSDSLSNLNTQYTQDKVNYAKKNEITVFSENLSTTKSFSANEYKLGNETVIKDDSGVKIGNTLHPLELISQGNIKVNGKIIDFDNLSQGSGTYTLPSSVVHNNQANNFSVIPQINGVNVATETFISSAISNSQYVLPNNVVKNDENTNFSILPKYNNINLATETWVQNKIDNIPQYQLPNIVAFTDRENNFTTTQKINGKEISTEEYVDNKVSNIPSYTLPNNVVKNDIETNFTVIPKINNKEITTKEYVDNKISNFELPSNIAKTNTDNYFTGNNNFNYLRVKSNEVIPLENIYRGNARMYIRPNNNDVSFINSSNKELIDLTNILTDEILNKNFNYYIFNFTGTDEYIGNDKINYQLLTYGYYFKYSIIVPKNKVGISQTFKPNLEQGWCLIIDTINKKIYPSGFYINQRYIDLISIDIF